MSDLITIKGGYSKKDNFKNADKSKNLTNIVGLPARYRERLDSIGMRLIQDKKGKSIELSLKQKSMLDVYEKSTSKIESEIICKDGKAEQYDCNKMDMLSHIPLSQFSSSPGSANDIWGFMDLNDQREYAVMGLQNGTVVVDVTDPTKPKEVGTIAGKNSTWRDVKVYQYFDKSANRWQSYAYVTTEARQGLQVIDLTELPEKVSLAGTYDEFSSAHNVYLANTDYATGKPHAGMDAYAYILGSNLARGAFRVLDLSNPTEPTLATAPPIGTEYIHDATTLLIEDERVESCQAGHDPCEIFVDFNENTVDIWDMTNKDMPKQISSTPYQGAAYTHSGWWSKDKKYIFVHDELDEKDHGANTTLRTLDISNLESPYISNVWTGPTAAIDHNGFTVGDKYYMSNYRRGVSVLDVSDPNAPKELGFFDTFPAPAENSAEFNGAWGTYPYLPSGNILVSDIEYGLYVIRDNT